MSLDDLLWAPPLLLAIAVVLGTAGRHRTEDILATIRRRFIELLVGVAAVGIFIRVIVTFFA